MKILAIVLMVFSVLAFAQQEPKMLPGEDKDQAAVMFETITQMQGGIVANAARVRAQQREIDRLAAENKALKTKCGKPCEEQEKK